MAERRMFSKDFTGRDSFISLSHKAQTLYFHLAINADDDGFCSSVKSTMRKLKIREASLDELKLKGLVYEFETGVVLVMHWLLHNRIRPDRYKPTTYTQEMSCVTIGKGDIYLVYECHNDFDIQIAANGSGSATKGSGSATKGSDSAPQDSGGDINSCEVIIGCDSSSEVSNYYQAPVRYGMFNNVILTAEKYNKLVELYPTDYRSKIDKLSSHMYSTGKDYKDHFSTIVKWAIEDESANNKKQNKGSNRYSSNAFKRVLETGEVNDD